MRNMETLIELIVLCERFSDDNFKITVEILPCGFILRATIFEVYRYRRLYSYLYELNHYYSNTNIETLIDEFKKEAFSEYTKYITKEEEGEVEE